MSGARKFKVVTSGFYSCSVEDWVRSRKAPQTELPRLTEGQKDFASRFGLPEQEYARHLLANRYGRERIVRGAQELGETIDHLLGNGGSGGRVLGIKADLSDGPREVWLETKQGRSQIAVPPALATALLRRGRLEAEEKEQLKKLLITGLGRSEVTPKRKAR